MMIFRGWRFSRTRCSNPPVRRRCFHLIRVHFCVSFQVAARIGIVRARAFLHRSLLYRFVCVVGTIRLGCGGTGVWLKAYELVIAWSRLFIVIMGLFMLVSGGGPAFTWTLFRLPAKRSLGDFGLFLIGVFGAGWRHDPVDSGRNRPGGVISKIGTWYMVTDAMVSQGLSCVCLPLTFASSLYCLRIRLPASRWLLVIMGILLVTDETKWITIWLQQTTGWSGM